VRERALSRGRKRGQFGEGRGNKRMKDCQTQYLFGKYS